MPGAGLAERKERVPDLEEIRETVKDTVKDAAQQISDATKDAVQQLVQQSLLQLIETAKTLAEQAIVGAKQSAESAVMSHMGADQATASPAGVVSESRTAAPVSDLADAADSLAESVDEQPAEERSGGGFFRFVLVGLLIGALVAYFTQRGGDEDEDFGEENWIEVKHDETGTGPARPEKSAPDSGMKAAEPEASPSQGELDARVIDH